MSNKLIAKYYKDNYKYLVRNLRPRFSVEDAEEIVGEAFTRAVRYISNFDPDKGKFENWINGIVYNCVMSHEKERLTRASIISSNIPDLPLYMEPTYEDNTLEGQEHIDRVVKKIEGKSQPARDILYLHHVMGYTPKQIQNRLGLGNKNIRQHLWRFKRSIK